MLAAEMLVELVDELAVGTAVEVIGLNEASATMVDRFGISDKKDAEALVSAH